MSTAKDNAPLTWAVQSLGIESSLKEGAVASVLENINFVMLIYPSAADQSKLVFGNWLEAGTAPAIAKSNLIQKWPALKSHLAVTLQDYHQVFAVSQANINATLKYYFSQNSKLNNFNYIDDPTLDANGDPKWTTKIEGLLSPPTVTLFNSAEGLDSAIFFVNFSPGIFSQFTRRKNKHPMAGWTVAFKVDLARKTLAESPDDIKKQV